MDLANQLLLPDFLTNEGLAKILEKRGLSKIEKQDRFQLLQTFDLHIRPKPQRSIFVDSKTYKQVKMDSTEMNSPSRKRPSDKSQNDSSEETPQSPTKKKIARITFP